VYAERRRELRARARLESLWRQLPVGRLHAAAVPRRRIARVREVRHAAKDLRLGERYVGRLGPMQRARRVRTEPDERLRRARAQQLQRQLPVGHGVSGSGLRRAEVESLR
jgi:hypothetical protein